MKYWKYLFNLFILVVGLLVIAVSQIPDKDLHVIACDVGTGDAILIIQGNNQILTDGGPDKKVLDCLGKYIPFWDKEIELIISTHPDADHSTGLIDVIQKYNVASILMNNKDSGTQVYKALENAVGGMGVAVIKPVYGQRLRLGLIHLDILSIFDETSKDTNANSIVYKLSFGRFSGLFTGDMPPNVSDELSGRIGKVNYIKIPHHGSKNGITDNLLRVIVPNVAVISVGKNQWGFPNDEILNMLTKYNTKILRTDEMGDIEVVTDGEKYWVVD